MDIYDLLYRLGVTANYAGFFQTASAVQLCMERPERLLLVTKWVYPDVARYYKTNWKAVERNIRTVNGIIWKQNRPFLEKLAGRELSHKPSNAQLLAILAYSLLSQNPGSLAVDGPGEKVVAKDSIPLEGQLSSDADIVYPPA